MNLGMTDWWRNPGTSRNAQWSQWLTQIFQRRNAPLGSWYMDWSWLQSKVEFTIGPVILQDEKTNIPKICGFPDFTWFHMISHDFTSLSMFKSVKSKIDGGRWRWHQRNFWDPKKSTDPWCQDGGVRSRWRDVLLNCDDPISRQSMGWLKGKSTGNLRFSHEIWDFPVFFPLNQSIETKLSHAFSWSQLRLEAS